MRRRLIPAVLAAVFALSWAAPAFAVMYATEAHPLKAEDNGGDGNAWIWGRVSLENRTGMRSAYHFRDSAPGGNSAYAQTTWYFYRDCTGKLCWDYDAQDRSSNNNSGDWIAESDWDDLDHHANSGRGIVRVCEAQHWSPDPCSKAATVSLNY
jgi:hypothetical protein